MLIAEGVGPRRGERGEGGEADRGHKAETESSGRRSTTRLDSASGSSSLRGSHAEPIGYCIGVDKYFKREDVGVIYQMNITPGRQRGLVGATLLKAMFERSAYGVRLFCCWCAQDLAANRFWEAMGFVPLAFRTGSRKRGPRNEGRVHIFWQKKIREEDLDGSGGGASGGWWFPSQTGSGAIREDRIVLPIPPGTHWSDAKPRVLPAESGVAKLLEDAANERKRLEAAARPSKEERAARRAAVKREADAAAARAKTVSAGGLHFGSANAAPALASGRVPSPEAKAKVKKPRPAKNDPKLVAAARELRDRWLEQAAASPGLIEQSANGKYAVARKVERLTRASGVLPMDQAGGNEPREFIDVEAREAA